MSEVVEPTGASFARDLARIGALAETRPPISLREVDATADLQTRQDRKYLLPLGLLAELVDDLGPNLRVLEVDGVRTFGYESVYFDTPDLRFYRDHLQGRRLRFKVRTRCYTDSGLTVLELKEKGRRGATVKHRVAHQPHHMTHLDDPARDWLGSFLTERTQPTDLRPSLVSRYRRTTFVDPVRHLRVTCDLALEFESHHHTHLVPAGQVLVETKSATGRSVADVWLSRRGHRDISVSKYCTGIALTTGMRANPWHRLIRTRFMAPARTA